nr:hypothetical protein [uncultured Acetatifactor sp.]
MALLLETSLCNGYHDDGAALLQPVAARENIVALELMGEYWNELALRNHGSILCSSVVL